MLAVEDSPTGAVRHELQIEGYTPEQIGYHSYLVVNAGLAEGTNVGTMFDTGGPKWRIRHLTSAGHDFADAARNDTIWHKATGIVKDKVGGVTLDVFKQVLASVIKGTLGL